MGRAKLLEQFVFAWYYGIACAYLLFECLLKSAHIPSRMSAPYATKKSIKMGVKDLKLFPMEQISVTKIQGRTNTRQNEAYSCTQPATPADVAGHPRYCRAILFK